MAWSNWESLGGIIDGSPAAVSWSSGRIDVFARETGKMKCGAPSSVFHRGWTTPEHSASISVVGIGQVRQWLALRGVRPRSISD